MFPMEPIPKYECKIKKMTPFHKIEYDFLINEKTLTFFIFPKEYKKNPSEGLIFMKSMTKSKTILSSLLLTMSLRTPNLSEFL